MSILTSNQLFGTSICSLAPQKPSIVWECTQCGNDNSIWKNDDGTMTCSDCAELEEEKRQRNAEANEY